MESIIRINNCLEVFASIPEELENLKHRLDKPEGRNPTTATPAMTNDGTPISDSEAESFHDSLISSPMTSTPKTSSVTSLSRATSKVGNVMGASEAPGSITTEARDWRPEDETNYSTATEEFRGAKERLQSIDGGAERDAASQQATDDAEKTSISETETRDSGFSDNEDGGEENRTHKPLHEVYTGPPNRKRKDQYILEVFCEQNTIRTHTTGLETDDESDSNRSLFLTGFLHTDAVLTPLQDPPNFGSDDILFMSPVMTLKQTQHLIDQMDHHDKNQVKNLAIKNSLWAIARDDIIDALATFSNLKNLILVAVEGETNDLGPLHVNPGAVKFVSMIPRDVFREDTAQRLLASAFKAVEREDVVVLVDVMLLERAGQLCPSGNEYAGDTEVAERMEKLESNQVEEGELDVNREVAEALSKIGLDCSYGGDETSETGAFDDETPSGEEFEVKEDGEAKEDVSSQAGPD